VEIYEKLKIFDRVNGPSFVRDRNGYLEQCSRDRIVLHVGCADSPMTETRLRDGTLLHTHLQRSAKSILGIDISSEGIEMLRRAGIPDVALVDAEDMTFKGEFDLVVAGDVLEHLNNPGRFVDGAARSLRRGGELVVAVPSALTANNMKAWLFKREQVHKAHCYYFSPKTLSALCARYGLTPVHLAFTTQSREAGEPDWFIWLRETIISISPPMAPSIIMHFKKTAEVDYANYYFWG